MPALLLYLLQVNIGFALLYLTYQLVLRPTTFYQFNRWFLVVGLVVASLLPLFDFTELFTQNEQVYQTFTTFSGTWTLPPVTETAEITFDYWQIPVYLFWLGAGAMLVRLVIQLASLYNLHKQSQLADFQGIQFRQLAVDFPPFSFANIIYFNPNLHPEQDWLPILKHEHTHVKQWHSLDILLVELTCLFHWFNPAVWLLRIAIKQNLEFLTDQQTLEAGIDKKQYQFSLLQTAGASPVSFASSFNYQSLKHRIMMMNKAPSTRVQQARFLIAIPALALSLFSLQGLAQTSPVSILEQTTQEGPGKKKIDHQAVYEAFLKRNPTVKRLQWSQDKLMVHLKSGKVETYAATPKGTAAAEKKYGTLPYPPPPPPPAPAAPNAPDASLAPPPPPPPMNVELPADFKKRNPTVKGISASEDSFHVILKNGEVESFDATEEGRIAFEKKYGTLPPPPPPVRVKVNEMAPPPPKVKKKHLPPSPPTVIVDEMAPPPPPKVKKREKPTHSNVRVKFAPKAQPLFHVQLPQKFTLRNPSVQSLHVNPNTHSLNVVLKDGKMQSFATNSAGLTAFEKNYGPLPPPLVNQI
jgi:hypothetical protein